VDYPLYATVEFVEKIHSWRSSRSKVPSVCRKCSSSSDVKWRARN